MRNAVAVWLVLAGLGASGQAADPGIVVNLDVGYNTAYRDGSWTPVDVFVENKQRDFSGWAEVRVFDATDTLQSPTYRVAAECPQNSKKRFRLYAWIEDASRIEAVLIENGRLAVDAPAYVEPRPIRSEDLLAIVLDEDPLNYTFLYDALGRFDENPRISRMDVDSTSLNLLPDHLACYESIDFVVVGDIDLSRVSPRQRRVLLEYVELGGTLAVFTGVQATSLRESWLAPHLGVGIGPVTTQPEEVFRAAVFGQAPPDEYDPERMCTTAALIEVEEAVQTLGETAVLAARRYYGKGQVITFAVDAASYALQDDPRYVDVWHGILRSLPKREARLNTGFVDMTFINNLPQVSGVTIRPVSDVLMYLGLYIGLGIVANWVFWSRMGRREYAWLTLLVVSFSFTAYAVVSGTNGFEGRLSRHSATLLHVGGDLTLAREYEITGVLSGRVIELNEPLEREDVLIREAGLATSAGRWGVVQSTFQRPFTFVQEPQPSVHNLRIGANEVRGYSATGYRRLDGAIDGVVAGGAGTPSVQVRDRSGLELESPMLFWRGEFYPLEHRPEDQVYTVTSNTTLHDGRMQVFDGAGRGAYWPGAFYSTDWDNLVSYLILSSLIDEEISAPDPYLGPYFIAQRIERGGAATQANRDYSATIVLAELREDETSLLRYPLTHRIGSYSRYFMPKAWSEHDWHGTIASQPLDLYLSAPQDKESHAGSRIEIALTYQSPEYDVSLAPFSDPARPIAPESTAPHPESRSDRPVFVKRYRIDDWSTHRDPVSGEVRFRIVAPSEAQSAPISVHIRAEVVVDSPGEPAEEWPAWR